MRLATWNVNSVQARLPRLLGWLDQVRPDVLCLQETKAPDSGFPTAEVGELGDQAALYGTGRWNGVAILSVPAWTMCAAASTASRASPTGRPGPSRPPARAAGCGRCTCRTGGRWTARTWTTSWPGWPRCAKRSAGAGRACARAAAGQPRLVVCGDFNIALTDADVWDPAAFADSTHVTPAERAALTELLALGLTDVPPRALKGQPFTYWDYRAGMFHKGMGMRIDLVLASAPVAAAVKDAYIDREARKGKGPSDHAPVVVDLELTRLRAGPAGSAVAATGTGPGV